MYYPIGWHRILRVDTRSDHDGQPSKVLALQANHERELYFILTTKSIHIWFPRPAAEIVCHRRSLESIAEIGLNKSAVWKTDSSVIVVLTERDQLLFFQVRKRASASTTWSFLSSSPTDIDSIYRLKNVQRHTKKFQNGETSSSSDENASVPALTLFSFGKLDLSSVGVSCLMSAEEELIVGTRNGQIYGIQWDGNVDEKFPWSLSKEVHDRMDFLVDIKFSSILSGFSLVFRSGRVGFMPLKIESSEGASDPINCDTNISYLASVTNAVCTEINHRHRLVAFGLKDSRVIVCSVGESNTMLVEDHKLLLKPCKTQNNNSDLGRVECLSYSPDNFAIAVTWEGGDLALWTVFGSLLFSSQQWRPQCSLGSLTRSMRISDLAWGREGYNLWLCTIKDDCEEEACQSFSSTNGRSHIEELDALSTTSCTTKSDVINTEEVMVMSLARCNLATSPHQSCSADSIVLISDEKIYIGPSIPHEDKFDHWIVINIPQEYLKAHYPVRYATVDRDCKRLAIAGNKGIALCSIGTSEWTYFIKKSQEGNLTVCGDLMWWREYLVLSCFNFSTESFELRAYQTSNGTILLSDKQAIIHKIPMEVIRMSIFESRLLVLYSDGTLAMFMLNLRLQPKSPQNLTVQIAPIENLCIANLQANPFCISSLALTRLHFKNNRSDDSILLNSCGKLFLLEREAPPDPSSNVIFKTVSVIATSVEQFWISPEISIASDMSYFKKSLWLACGDLKNRLKVWLPLLNDKNHPPTELYVPDRIMLPVKCDIYPLAIRSSGADLVEPDDAIVLGAESDVLYRDCKLFRYFPYTDVKRQCRVYLHKILRELLLSQHLGYYAKKIAESCQSLPYFAHCLELLLHEVLEEEATSPVPLPDPMLPEVIKFIKEFSVYPETVVHCARKSELSMWSCLFNERAVGSPKKLFQECIELEKFDTAASCLIILQSLDKSTISTRMVRELMRLVKKNPKFNYLVDDLESFLTRADIVDSQSSSPVRLSPNSPTIS